MIELTCAALLLDMDGVLVDSRAVVRRVWRRWSARTGVDATRVLAVAHGRRTIDTLRSIAPHLDADEELRWLSEAELSDRDGIVAVPGATDLVARLPEDRWAVVTSAGRELAMRRLGWAGLPRPVRLVSSDDVQRGKPSPEGYLRAADLLCVDPGTCLVVEDAPAGVEAAQEAGMRVVAVITTHEPGELTPVAAVVPDLRAIEVERAGRFIRLRIG